MGRGSTSVFRARDRDRDRELGGGNGGVIEGFVVVVLLGLSCLGGLFFKGPFNG